MPDIPKVIGKYEVLELVGRGGMGSVYKSWDPVLDRYVAIKVVHSALNEIERERFLREARAAARLHHPNLVSIYDIDIKGDAPYIVQEWLTGTDVDKLLERTVAAFDLNANLGVLIQVGRGLGAAHKVGIVHRDVKPSNIRVLESGVAKMMDFGIAKLIDDTAATATMTRAFVGTLRYASPEHLAGGKIGPAADVFSFGLLAYELISGRPAIQKESMLDIVDSLVHGHIPRLGEVGPDYPPDLDRVVSDCLQLTPSKRPASMAQVTAKLTGLRRQLGFVGPVEDAVAAAMSRFTGSFTTTSARHSAQLEPTAQRDFWADSPIHLEATRRDAEARARPGAFELGSASSPGGASLPSEQLGKLPSHALGSTSASDVVVEGGTRVIPHIGLGAEKAEDLPRQVGRYTLRHFIVRGRTGNLYKAYDPVRQRLVGLKVLHDEDGVAQKRLLRDARIWLDFDHPNLVRVLDVDLGGADHPPLVVTELIEGVDLASLAMQLSMRKKLRVTIQLCAALEYMHNRGVVHREVNPRNVLVCVGTNHATLLDSGIARRTNPNIDQLTHSGVVVGDRVYIAPEQLRGSLDPRSDIYSVGAVLCEMLLGESVYSLGIAAARERMEREVHPESLRETVARALQASPDERFSRVEELADRLEGLAPKTPSEASLSRVVVTLHGIRTHASWQRAFSEVATQKGLECRLDRWNYGYFSVVKFLLPSARLGRVSWFRETYDTEFSGKDALFALSEERPSIVAHSFGTYILGNALLRYPYLRFNKVLLCGSILPRSFPWEALIARGQVQAVRNEYGARDGWTRRVQWFVPGTGPSGINGFDASLSDRFEQERFDFDHSEYFARSHMVPLWIPFLRRRMGFNAPRALSSVAEYSTTRIVPWGLVVGYAGLVGGAVLLWLFVGGGAV